MLAVVARAVVELGEGRDDIPPEAVLGQDSGFAPYLPHARDDTSGTCDEVPCRWAVASDTAAILMFDSQSDAQRFVDASDGDARRSGWMAVVFAADGLDDERRDELVGGLGGLYTSD